MTETISHVATLTEVDLLHSAQAYGAAPYDWGFCWFSSFDALSDLGTAHPDPYPNGVVHADIDPFWESCRYVEGWLIDFIISPDPDHINDCLLYTSDAADE